MTSKKEQRQRSIVTRYPGIFTDWSGTSLSGKLRNQITVGNIVRIPLEGIPLKGIPKGIGNDKGQLNSEGIYDVIVSTKMPTKIFKDFCPERLLEGWAEILEIFGQHFGRNDDHINSF